MSLLDSLPFFTIKNSELLSIFRPNLTSFNFSNAIYSSTDELKHKVSSINLTNKRYLSIFHLNVRSLVKNFDNLHLLINSLPVQPDIIAITETKLNCNSHIDFIQLDNYNFIRKDSPSVVEQEEFVFTLSKI